MVKIEPLIFDEFHSDKFILPPITLKRGELIGIFVGYDSESDFLKDKIINRLTSYKKTKNQKIVHYIPNMLFKRVSKFQRFIESFFPPTVSDYLSKNANLKSKLPKKIYEIDYVKPSTKIFGELGGNASKKLSLYCGLSKFDNIIFTLEALSLHSEEEIFDFVYNYVKENNKTAIFLDHTNSYAKRCDQYIIPLKNNKNLENYYPKIL